MEPSSSRLFINADTFTEHYLVPVVRGRDEQLRQLRLCLAPVFRGGKPLHALLVGPAGAGKTLVAGYGLAELKSKGIHAAYVNCMEHSTLYAVLEKIIADLKILRSERISTAYKLEQIVKFLKDRPLVVVLDEIHRIPPKDRAQTLYNLSNLGKLGLVCVCSNPHFLQSLDENVRSRLSPTVIDFPLYTAEELQGVLAQRADVGLVSGACSEEALTSLSQLAGGDARTAIHALRRAAVNAGQRAAEVIETRDVRNGWQNGPELKRAYVLGLLNDHQRALFRILQEFGEMTSTRLWQEYMVECERIGLRLVAPRTFTHYMRKLEIVGLVEVRKAQAKGNVRVFRVVSLQGETQPSDAETV